MNEPYFIGIGVQRSATSWLYECLRVHPQIYMPYKELQFFNKQYDQGIEWYLKHFDEMPEGEIAGEFTPDYLSSPAAVSRIHENLPDAKLIVILREPIERAFSAFQLHRSHGDYQGLSFREAIELNPALINNGLYFEQLTHLFSLFERDQVEIFFHDDVALRGAEVYRRVCEFLGVDTTFVPMSLGNVRNTSAFAALQGRSGLNRLLALYRAPYLKWLRTLFNATGVKHALRARLATIQRASQEEQTLSAEHIKLLMADTAELEHLMGVDLHAWKKKQAIYR